MNTSEALTLTLKSGKFRRSRCSTWRSADSTRACGVGSPYFFCRSFSSEPALTPMRIGIPRSRAASTTALTRSARPILPGLMRRQSTPSSATRRAIWESKWISASSGRLTCCLILPKASAASMSGTEMRTISAPASCRRRTWATVAATSLVSVLVMLCTAMGASPPTGTEPTQILRVRRRLIGDSQCMLLPTQLYPRGFTRDMGHHIDRLAVVADLRAPGKAQAQLQRRLAGQLQCLALALERTEQHLATGIGHLRPAVGDKTDIYPALTGRDGRRLDNAGRRWTGGLGNAGRFALRHFCSRLDHRDRRLLGRAIQFRRRRLFDGGGRQAQLSRALGCQHGLILGLIQRMDLRRAIGAFHFKLFETGNGGLIGMPLGLLLPPIKADTSKHHKQGKTDETQDALRITHRLFDMPQAVYIAAHGIAARELIELLYQTTLVHAQKLCISANIATGKGITRQLIEASGFDLTQAQRCEIELGGHFINGPAPALASLAQRLTGVDASGRYNFRMRRFHHCSDRYC